MIRKGRFASELNEKVAKFTSSIEEDIRLFDADILLNKAHVNMLYEREIITKNEYSVLLEGLNKIMEKGVECLDLEPSLEDIHMAIEKQLTQIVGEIGKKLHTARSRNDQVATDLRIVLRQEVKEIIQRIDSFQKMLLEESKNHVKSVMIGYTHLQQAQVTTLAHYLLSYVSMMDRDKERLEGTLKRINLSPLGACAFNTTSYNISREQTAEELGFDGVLENSIDAVSSRDFILEVLANLSILCVNLSRLVQDLILWNTQEFDYIELPDEYCSTSSIMPQKKNPDVLELIRAKIASVLGGMFSGLSILKGLPQTYNRDLQEMTVHLWQGCDATREILEILYEIVGKSDFKIENMYNKAKSSCVFATDLADFLVRKKGIPFREAHSLVGSLIREMIDENLTVDAENIYTIIKLKTGISLSKDEINEILDPYQSIESKNVLGGPAPNQTSAYIKRREDR